MGKVLILTGVTGKKSGKVLTEYINKNYETVKNIFSDGIRAIVRNTSDTKVLEKNIPDIEKCCGKITDVAFLQDVFKDADTVVHIAGIHWSREIVSAAVACGVRRLILVHTTGIYSKYKAAGEEYRQIDAFVYDICKKNNIKLTILRPTMIYGNLSDHNVCVFIKMVDKLPVMPVVNGACYELQPVNYHDLGKAYYDVLMHEKETANKDFILSGGAPILLRDMLIIIGKNLGKKVHFISVPYWIAYLGAIALYVFTLGRFDFREKVQRLCEPRIYSFEAASKAFGYMPMTFEVGIEREIEKYRKG